MFKLRRLYLWGFTEEDTILFQHRLENVEPVHIDALPVPEAVPIVVHVRALQAFQEAVDALPECQLPDAVLYLPQGVAEPASASTYVDTTIEEGTWTGLEELLIEPDQFRLANLVYQLPAAFVEKLNWPISDLDLTLLPLLEEDRRLLSSSPVARQAFNRALADRRWLLGTIAPVRPHKDSSTAILRIPIRRLPTRLSERLATVLERLSAAFAALVYGGLQTPALHLTSPAITMRGDRRDDEWPPFDTTQMLTKILGDVAGGASLSVQQGVCGALLTSSDDGQTVEIGPLYVAETPIRHFRIQLTIRDAHLWSGLSEEGVARIPLNVIEQALADDDGELNVVKLVDTTSPH